MSLLASTLLAQAPIATLAPAPIAIEKPAGVSGVVVDSLTGTPVPRVHVMLGLDSVEERTYGAMTASDGRFSITGIVPESYSVTAERVGYSMPMVAGLPERNVVVLDPGSQKDDLRLQLVPAGAISGRVTNADGEPLEGVEVQAESFAGVAASDVVGKTDATGYFRIGGLAPGTYRVKATPENLYTPAEVRTDGTVDSQDALSYYPQSMTFRQGARVVVPAGAEASGVEIRLLRVPVVAVSGTVEGVPPGGFNAQLWVAQAGGLGRSTAGIKPDGTFRLWRLYPGKYQISAMWQAPGGRFLQSTPVEVEVGNSNVGKLILRVIPPADISGRVDFQDDGARPAKNVTAKLTLVNAGMQGGAKAVDIAADGSFQIAQLPPGRYRLGLSWSSAYIASTRLGQEAVDGSLLDLSGGASAGELSIRVSSSTGYLTGRVTDDTGPAGGAQVALAFDGAGVPPRFATVGAGGTYSFNGVAPGKYKLVVVQEADAGYVTQSGRLEDYEELMEYIEIHPGEKASHDLKRSLPSER